MALALAYKHGQRSLDLEGHERGLKPASDSSDAHYRLISWSNQ